jgi:hypothetical protein
MLEVDVFEAEVLDHLSEMPESKRDDTMAFIKIRAVSPPSASQKRPRDVSMPPLRPRAASQQESRLVSSTAGAATTTGQRQTIGTVLKVKSLHLRARSTESHTAIALYCHMRT